MYITWSIPRYPSVLGVGRVCAGHMEGDYEAPLARERKAKSLVDRRARWMKAAVEEIKEWQSLHQSEWL